MARAFAALGADVVDADDVGACAVARPAQPGYAAVVAAFGSAVPAAPTASSTARGCATARSPTRPSARASRRMLHPLIAARIDDAVARWRGAYGILVVPLLLERGDLRRASRACWSSTARRTSRCGASVARSGLAPREVRAIMATQLSRAARLARADDVIDNSGALAGAAPAGRAARRRYRALAPQRSAERRVDDSRHNDALSSPA